MASIDFAPAHKIENYNRKSPNTLTKIGAVIVASLVVGGIADHLRGHGYVRQPEVVQPYDTAWDLVRRADKDAGIDPDSVDMRPAVDRVVEQYGTNLKPGERVVVKLDK